MTSQVMTTEELRAQRKPENVEANFNTYRGFQAMHHMAESLANSTIIPEAFRNTIMVKDRYDQASKRWLFKPEPNPNGVSNCIIALNMAQRLGADPMMIMQNLYLVDGRPSWSSQFIIAAINSCGRYSPLRFDITGGDEEIEIPYAVTEWEYNQDTRKREPVESTKVAKVKNLKCVAWVNEKATGERLESSPISMELAVKEGWFQKNGSKWQTMPEQMLRYRAASFFGRIYAPDLLMGLKTQEEELDSIIDITPVPEQDVTPVTLDTIKQAVIKSPAETEKQVEPRAEEVTQVENVQNTTSNDVTKKPTSTEVRKEYLDQIANFTHTKDLQTIIPFIKGHEILTDAHKTYLVNAVNQKIEDLNKAAQAQKAAGVDKIKSQSLVNGLKTMVNDAQNMADLQLVVEQFNGSKSKIDSAHAQDFMKIYSERKAFIESQLTMFEGTEEQPAQNIGFTDRAIARIYAAKNQDDINAEFMDPEFEEQSDQDKQRITIAAQEREQQLLG